ncbi:VOC family protein [Siphonobacter sp. SORGH_AS_1065]|uniref:VOC family protein n=1 Tax=Siphonobacter sp. SORGH_AS_1065 TaxID=3041795 RepID=UPI0027D824D7|nr:VOC family protein [Siphonobacter sp. SORGH_AS_1065]
MSIKMNAGIITSRLAETKRFYQEVFQFGITFENDFFVLMHTPDRKAEISFMLPEHPSQHPLFHPEFDGKGIFLTLEVPNVDEAYEKIKDLKIPIVIELRDEPWGDRHFAFTDPNGIGIDVVTYTQLNIF